jgi:hypothetical protein
MPDQIFILSRILFLCTASGPPFIQTLIEQKYRGRTVVEIISRKLDLLMSAILPGTNMAREAMSDLLKFAFNLLLYYPKVCLRILLYALFPLVHINLQR